MQIKKTNFENLFVISKKPFKDNRGFFYRDFCKNELSKIYFEIKQTNISFNKKKYTLRGFHKQSFPYEEKKILTCLSGEFLNVSIDLRKKSKTYLKVYKIKLSEKNNLSIHVPKGFANAYMTLKNNTKILYYMSEFYKPKKEQHIRFNDNFFSIKWPKKPSIISKKDLNILNFKPDK
jgi:dTDP-4-dehydrorhamnose 3,5-epimerase